MPVTLPDYPPTAGQKAKASQVIGWLAALIAKFAGGITTLDVSSVAGITGSQLSNSSGTRITASNLETDSVDNRALKDDPTAGSAAAAVKRDNIVDREVVQSKIALASISKAELKYTEVTQAFSVSSPGLVAITRVVPSPALPAMSAMLPIRLTVEGVSAASGVSHVLASLSQEGAGTPFWELAATNSAASSPTTGTVRFGYLSTT